MSAEERLAREQTIKQLTEETEELINETRGILKKIKELKEQELTQAQQAAQFLKQSDTHAKGVANMTPQIAVITTQIKNLEDGDEKKAKLQAKLDSLEDEHREHKDKREELLKGYNNATAKVEELQQQIQPLVDQLERLALEQAQKEQLLLGIIGLHKRMQALREKAATTIQQRFRLFQQQQTATGDQNEVASNSHP